MSVQFKKILAAKRVSVIIFFIYFWSATSMATSIKGQLEIDDSWEPVVYLSLINSFDDLNTASYDFLVYDASIDSNGYFKMLDFSIPESERIYRLHICKKGDPVSTIMIGGTEENFIHFIMKNNDSILVNSDNRLPGFKNSIVTGHNANESLRKLLKIRKGLQSPPSIPSIQNRQLLREQVLKDYKILADTSTHNIIQLITLYFAGESFASSELLGFLKETHEKLQANDTSSPYYKDFVSELNYMKFQTNSSSDASHNWIIWSGILLVIVIIVGLNYLSKKRPNLSFETETNSLIGRLSIQEKRVLDLLKEGKSNKEISNELHIEVSTVKSHLNKIYSRLGVKSRKEIVNAEW